MNLQRLLNILSNNVPAILFFVFAVGLPLLARIQRKLLEVKREREAAMRRDRDELERLRTGRAPSPPPQVIPEATSARQSLEEIAEVRRRRIEEMRRRQTGVTASPAPAPQQGATRLVRLPGGIVLEIPAEMTQQSHAAPAAPATTQRSPMPQRRPMAAPPTQRPRPQPARTAHPRPAQRPGQRPPQRPAPPPPQREEDPGESVVHRLVADAAESARPTAGAPSVIPGQKVATAPRAGRTMVFTKNMSKAELRRAVVLGEIFGPATSARM